MRKSANFLSVIIVVILFSCNNNVPPSGGSNSSLEKTHWVLSGLPGLSGGLPSMPKEVTLMLDSARASGFAGCNRYFGGFASVGSTLKFTGVGSTKMFCEGTQKVEDAFLQALNNTEGYHITGSRLSLLKGSDTLAQFQAGKHAQ